MFGYRESFNGDLPVAVRNAVQAMNAKDEEQVDLGEQVDELAEGQQEVSCMM